MRRGQGRRPGAYLSEKIVGFRMAPENFQKLQQEAWTARKSIAQIINEALMQKYGWTPALFEPGKKKKSKV